MALLEPPDKAWDRVEELLELALLLADRHDLDAFFASRLVGWGIKGNFGINASPQQTGESFLADQCGHVS